MSAPVLVTGAAGKTGLAVIRSLTARGAQVRALVRHGIQRETAASAGAVEARIVDLADGDALREAFRGVGAVYYICPNLRPDETELSRLAIESTLDVGVERFVYHSVLHPQTEKMPHHWQKLRVEETLLESGLQWTILQPTAYMQNMLAVWDEVIEEGIFRVPYPVTSRIALVALENVAEVAAKVISEDGHTGATYELVGTAPLTQTAVAGALGRALEQSVVAVETPTERVREALEGQGLGPYQVDTLMKMFDYYGRFGLEGSPRILSWLLGRQPTSLAEFVQRQVADGRS